MNNSLPLNQQSPKHIKSNQTKKTVYIASAIKFIYILKLANRYKLIQLLIILREAL